MNLPKKKPAKVKKPAGYTNAAPPTLGCVFGTVLVDEMKAREDAAARRRELDDMGFKPLKGGA